ncbi:MAG: 2-oxo acid dehydrogenase subunit E2 [Chitinispirillia bacterium]|nr:2-oxo acid dehydrogenase subunit E2 [Chitinispirillia bacterium]
MAEKILMIALSPTMEAGVITKWNKKVGDKVSTGDLLCEVETDKAAMDYESQIDGTILKILVPDKTRVKVGDPIAVIGEDGEEFSGLLDLSTEKKTAQSSIHSENLPGGVKASPLARETARKLGVDLHSVEGSGPGGRIVKEDVEQNAAAINNKKTTETGAVTFTAEKLSEKRRVTARRMSQSAANIPHFYLSIPVRMDSIIHTRNSLNKKRGKKISMNAFLIKFVTVALRRNPQINASWQDDSIKQFSNIDIGLAVALSDGLITPIVKNCEAKGILQIDDELKILIDKAKSGRLTPEEYTGATFTISNLGAWGVRSFTAIINPPASAILAVGEIFKEPVADEDEKIVVQSRMMLTLSSDHRVIDGAMAAAFAADLRGIMENPAEALF